MYIAIYRYTTTKKVRHPSCQPHTFVPASVMMNLPVSLCVLQARTSLCMNAWWDD